MFNKINIELTNSCNKECHICGRREREKKYPDLYNKDMSLELLEKITNQLPEECLIQLHSNGEPLMYPKLKEALIELEILGCAFGWIVCFDTNGILLVEKAKEIIDHCDVVTASIIEKDPTWKKQLKTLKEFLKIKGKKSPRIVLRYVGDIEKERDIEYKKLKLEICYRQLHSPKGSFGYKHKTVKPEYMICDEFLNHPAIDVDGNFFPCVRFDPHKLNMLGNVKEQSMSDIWESEKRFHWLQCHINGSREKIPLCKTCQYWGCPSA